MYNQIFFFLFVCTSAEYFGNWIFSFAKWEGEEALIEVGTMKESVSVTGLTVAISIVTYYRQNTLEIG